MVCPRRMKGRVMREKRVVAILLPKHGKHQGQRPREYLGTITLIHKQSTWRNGNKTKEHREMVDFFFWECPSIDNKKRRRGSKM